MMTSVLSGRLRSAALVRLPRLGLPWACAAVVALIALREFLTEPAALQTSLGDTDDATRLIEVRDLMANGHWFDMTLPRLGAPEPLVSHWSRLVDVPIALLIGLGRLFFSQTDAELFARALWPMLVLLLLLVLVTRELERGHGRLAAFVALALAATSTYALSQFTLGRIDHHNVMILCSICGLVLLARARDNPRTAAVAGLLLGLGLAVGYEPMLLVVPAVAIACLLGVAGQRWRASAACLTAGLTASLAAAFILTTPPQHWHIAVCDELSGNIVLLAAAGAAGSAAVYRLGERVPLWSRLLVLAAAGACGLILYGAMQPACLAGPFGQVDPAVGPIWLDHVSETQSIFWLIGKHTARGIAALAFMLIGVAAQAYNWRSTRSPDAAFLLAIGIIATAFACWQIKLMPYATWLAIWSLACLLAKAPGIGDTPARSVRLGGLVLLNQTSIATLISIVIGTLAVAGLAPAKGKDPLTQDAECGATVNVSALASLPKGLIVANIDLGPAIVALTGHSVLAAPYHRLDHAIIAQDAIWRAKPDEARRRLAALGASYVMICDKHHPNTKLPPDALEALLFAGAAPAFLEPVTLAAATPYKIWRMSPAR